MSTDNDVTDMIAQSLDLTPISQTPTTNITPLTPTAITVDYVEGNTEYETAKGNVENIIKVGTVAMNDLLDLAKLSQDPRAYRVLTELLGAMSSANKELMDIRAKEADIRRKDAKEDGPQTVNNNLLVGSTSEILQLMQKKNQ